METRLITTRSCGGTEKAPERFIVSYGFDDPTKADLEFICKEAQAGRLKGGVEVIVGKAAVQIGESIHRCRFAVVLRSRKRACTTERQR